MEKIDEELYLSLIREHNLEKIIKENIIIDNKYFGNFLIFNTIKYGDLKTLKYFLNIGGLSYFSQRSKYLKLAVENNNTEIIKYLISTDTYCEINDDNVREFSSCLNNLEYLKYFINNVNKFKNNFFYILLMCEYNEDEYDCIKYIFECDKLNIKRLFNNYNFQLLFNNIVNANKPKFVKLFIENGADLHYSDDMVYINTIQFNYYSIFKYIMNYDSNVDIYSLLSLSVRNGRIKFVKLLLDKYIKINDDKQLILFAINNYNLYECKNKWFNIIKVLLNYGSNTSLLTNELKIKLRYDKLNNLIKTSKYE